MLYDALGQHMPTLAARWAAWMLGHALRHVGGGSDILQWQWDAALTCWLLQTAGIAQLGLADPVRYKRVMKDSCLSASTCRQHPCADWEEGRGTLVAEGGVLATHSAVHQHKSII